MTETTTIQVRKDQAETLKEIARENGNYKTVIDRLLEGYNDTTDTAQNAELSLEATDYQQIAEAVAQELR